MTKKARRRQIMKEVGYTKRRIQELHSGFTYKREGELLKEELEFLLKELDAWSPAYETQHKKAYRGHVRDAVGIEYEGRLGWDRFDLHELTQIWREVKE